MCCMAIASIGRWCAFLGCACLFSEFIALCYWNVVMFIVYSACVCWPLVEQLHLDKEAFNFGGGDVVGETELVWPCGPRFGAVQSTDLRKATVAL